MLTIVGLLLVLIASMLALTDRLREKGRITKSGYIAIVAVLAFIVGLWQYIEAERARRDEAELACVEIQPAITKLFESDEKKELFKFRGASQDAELLARLHLKVNTASVALDGIAARHLGALELDQRAKLVHLLRGVGTVNDILDLGHNDFFGTAARARLNQLVQKGYTTICSE